MLLKISQRLIWTNIKNSLWMIITFSIINYLWMEPILTWGGMTRFKGAKLTGEAMFLVPLFFTVLLIPFFISIKNDVNLKIKQGDKRGKLVIINEIFPILTFITWIIVILYSTVIYFFYNEYYYLMIHISIYIIIYFSMLFNMNINFDEPYILKDKSTIDIIDKHLKK